MHIDPEMEYNGTYTFLSLSSIHHIIVQLLSLSHASIPGWGEM